MAHLAYLPELKDQARAAEFSVLVVPKERSQSFGTALFALPFIRAILALKLCMFIA